MKEKDIEELKSNLKKALSFLEESVEEYQEHADFCQSNNAFHSNEEQCSCGALKWINDRNEFIRKNTVKEG